MVSSVVPDNIATLLMVCAGNRRRPADAGLVYERAAAAGAELPSKPGDPDRPIRTRRRRTNRDQALPAMNHLQRRVVRE